jgi:hypothetical protein
MARRGVRGEDNEAMSPDRLTRSTAARRAPAACGVLLMQPGTGERSS